MGAAQIPGRCIRIEPLKPVNRVHIGLIGEHDGVKLGDAVCTALCPADEGAPGSSPVAQVEDERRTAERWRPTYEWQDVPVGVRKVMLKGLEIEEQPLGAGGADPSLNHVAAVAGSRRRGAADARSTRRRARIPPKWQLEVAVDDLGTWFHIVKARTETILDLRRALSTELGRSLERIAFEIDGCYLDDGVTVDELGLFVRRHELKFANATPWWI